MFTSTDKDDVVLVGSGSGGIEEVIKAMKEKDLSLGFLKLAEDSYGLINCFSLEATSERITSALLMLQEAKLLFVVSSNDSGNFSCGRMLSNPPT